MSRLDKASIKEARDIEESASTYFCPDCGDKPLYCGSGPIQTEEFAVLESVDVGNKLVNENIIKEHIKDNEDYEYFYECELCNTIWKEVFNCKPSHLVKVATWDAALKKYIKGEKECQKLKK